MRLWSLWAISRWEVATTANYNNQQTTSMNVHDLLDIFIVSTGTLAVLLTAAIFELIRERKGAKRTPREELFDTLEEALKYCWQYYADIACEPFDVK